LANFDSSVISVGDMGWWNNKTKDGTALVKVERVVCIIEPGK